jgi:hypothetical protein
VGLKSLKSLNLTNGYPNNKNKNKNNKVKSKQNFLWPSKMMTHSKIVDPLYILLENMPFSESRMRNIYH